MVVSVPAGILPASLRHRRTPELLREDDEGAVEKAATAKILNVHAARLRSSR